MTRLAAFAVLLSVTVPLVACGGEKECPPAPPCAATTAPPPAPPAPPPIPATPAGTPGPNALTAAKLSVNPEAGRNKFDAIFDLPAGERIDATSSAVGCTGAYDAKADSFSGTCDVPLTSLMVDGNETKTDHFRQWTTNKKSDPKDCRFEAKFENVRLASWLNPNEGVRFAGDVTFTVCGRARTDGGHEHIEGTAKYLPPEEAGDLTFVQIRADVAGFSRDRYQIGPAFTDGWLARVQKLANVVADQGTVSLSLFAKAEPADAASPSSTPASAPAAHP